MAKITIADRLASVRQKVLEASSRAGRSPTDVVLIAVSKTQPATSIREAYEAGQRDFGENYVQELVAKAESLRDLPDIRWHTIGHLQTNKVKQVCSIASVIHTVDRVSLAQELGKRVMGDRCTEVFVEVNVGEEESKTGCKVKDASQVVDAVREQIAAGSAMKLLGLMTVPPFDADVKETAVHFARLRTLAKEFGLNALSMGMSHDFEEAIEQGATMVRVGSAIFGERAK